MGGGGGGGIGGKSGGGGGQTGQGGGGALGGGGGGGGTEPGRALAAFEAARTAVLEQTEEGFLDSGMCCAVQKYAFVDPADARVHHCAGDPRSCAACPWRRAGDRCPWNGRLLPQQAAGDRLVRVCAGWRGPIAAGVPCLLE
mmetsp:Transcript_43711/g.115441  ORF Transcript_43711/g.115441 Transcript_43711/m.115441 type:complete len:142 (+) Transcript_43711:1289-1714(+)